MKMMRGMSQWIVVMLLALILFSLFESMALLLTESVPAIFVILVWYFVWKAGRTKSGTRMKYFFLKFSPSRFYRQFKLNMAYKRFQSKTKSAENGTIICRNCEKRIDPFSFGVSGRCPECGTKIL